MRLEFAKMSGCGNDFILIDNREEIIDIPKDRLAKLICHRHDGIGADGLITIEKSKVVDFKMKFYNSDGGEASMCGNGARCVSRFAYLKQIADKNMVFETLAGKIEGQMLDDKTVQINMGRFIYNPSSGVYDASLFGLSDIINNKLYYLIIGVPHLVSFWNEIHSIDVEKIGRNLRYDQRFKPEGCNVNFVKIIDKNSFSIRTYERGVEAETMACGTGSSASALVAASLGYVKMPVRIHTKNNCQLRVDSVVRENVFDPLLLSGEARMICEGSFFIDEVF